MTPSDFSLLHQIFASALERLASEYPERQWKPNKKAQLSHNMRSELFDLIEESSYLLNVSPSPVEHAKNQAIVLKDLSNGSQIRIRKGVVLDASHDLNTQESLDGTGEVFSAANGTDTDEFLIVWDWPEFDPENIQIGPVSLNIAHVIGKITNNRYAVDWIEDIPTDVEIATELIRGYSPDNDEPSIRVIEVDEDERAE